ncbi:MULTISPECIES: BON domain-containing protein [unclassified Microbacterium]|uniref:BON domain-containing protein n=1 Tax=unclassified Microbacterium TaxID=2609290 RepID=UPI000D001587|nr:MULTISPECIES: BON domain-containing protein [unclassified Microbacterium]PRB65276.1 transporter [Microbacterium sp. MYb45]
MTSTTHTDDGDLQRAVQLELEWTPDVDDAGIGVAVEDGTVALSGEVDSYSERLAARHAALRVRGVNAVVDRLSVPSSLEESMTDTAVAEEVEHALRAAADVPPGVKAVIDGGDVTLMGEVDWDHERRAAKRAVQHLTGVRTVNSMITLTARPSAADAEERIRGAIRRNALVDAHTIEVVVSGTSVTLTGTVRSWAEKNQAAEAAWASPHVTEVDNRIVVHPY